MYEENNVPMLDYSGKRIEEGFYMDKDSLIYVYQDKGTYFWLIERDYEKSRDSAFLTEDEAKRLTRVVNPGELEKQLMLQLKFLRRKIIRG